MHAVSVRIQDSLYEELLKQQEENKHASLSDTIREMLQDTLQPKTPPGFYHPYHTPACIPGANQIPTTRLELYRWYEYLFANNPHASLLLDELSERAITPYRLEGPNIDWAQQQLEPLNLREKMISILREYFGKGDCFTVSNLFCPYCLTEGDSFISVPPIESECKHIGAKFSSISILQPNTVENLEDLGYFLVPSAEVKRIVMTGKPEETYGNIPESVKLAVRRGQPIPIDPRFLCHFKRGNAFEKYGRSIFRSWLPGMIGGSDEDTEARVLGGLDSSCIGEEVKVALMTQAQEMLGMWVYKLLANLAYFQSVQMYPTVKWDPITRIKNPQAAWGLLQIWKEGHVTDDTCAKVLGLNIPGEEDKSIHVLDHCHLEAEGTCPNCHKAHSLTTSSPDHWEVVECPCGGKVEFHVSAKATGIPKPEPKETPQHWTLGYLDEQSAEYKSDREIVALDPDGPMNIKITRVTRLDANLNRRMIEDFSVTRDEALKYLRDLGIDDESIPDWLFCYRIH